MDATQYPKYDLVQWLELHRNWSEETFGEGRRTVGLTKHIQKELKEIQSAPNDVMEWIDVVILALDGAWRCIAYSGNGYENVHLAELIAEKLWEKQKVNLHREWERTPQNMPTEHKR